MNGKNYNVYRDEQLFFDGWMDGWIDTSLEQMDECLCG